MVKKMLHVETPLWESPVISRQLGGRALLKMEAFQPAGSFKVRGMGAACRNALEQGRSRVTCSSGGNAGLAVAYSGRVLGLGVTIVVPKSTSQRACSLIEQEGADVIIWGESWQEAHEYATELVKETDSAYIHPFDSPDVWHGHATMVEEIERAGVQPDAVVVSVGGGGLLCGLVEGMQAAGWTRVPVYAVETTGAASFASAVQMGELVRLDKIDSIAVTLGAKMVCRQALDWTRKHPIYPHLVSDRSALDACLAFADDHRVLVEPACGAALSLGYEGAQVLQAYDTVVFIVCGGAGVSREMLAKWDAAV